MFTKLVRIGKDAEMKQTNSGTTLLEMPVVYDIGYGENKKPQWVKVAMFGQRAEKLVSHFTKGTQIVATMDDVKSEAWISNGEAKSGMSAKLVDFEFAGGGQQSAQPQHRPQAPAAPQYQQAPATQQAAPQSWGTPPAQPQHRPQAPAAPQYQQAPATQQAAPQSWGTPPAQQQSQPAQPAFDQDVPF